MRARCGLHCVCGCCARAVYAGFAAAFCTPFTAPVPTVLLVLPTPDCRFFGLRFPAHYGLVPVARFARTPLPLPRFTYAVALPVLPTPFFSFGSAVRCLPFYTRLTAVPVYHAAVTAFTARTATAFTIRALPAVYRVLHRTRMPLRLVLCAYRALPLPSSRFTTHCSSHIRVLHGTHGSRWRHYAPRGSRAFGSPFSPVYHAPLNTRTPHACVATRYRSVRLPRLPFCTVAPHYMPLRFTFITFALPLDSFTGLVQHTWFAGAAVLVTLLPHLPVLHCTVYTRTLHRFTLPVIYTMPGYAVYIYRTPHWFCGSFLVCRTVAGCGLPRWFTDACTWLRTHVCLHCSGSVLDYLVLVRSAGYVIPVPITVLHVDSFPGLDLRLPGSDSTQLVCLLLRYTFRLRYTAFYARSRFHTADFATTRFGYAFTCARYALRLRLLLRTFTVLAVYVCVTFTFRTRLHLLRLVTHTHTVTTVILQFARSFCGLHLRSACGLHLHIRARFCPFAGFCRFCRSVTFQLVLQRTHLRTRTRCRFRLVLRSGLDSRLRFTRIVGFFFYGCTRFVYVPVRGCTFTLLRLPLPTHFRTRLPHAVTRLLPRTLRSAFAFWVTYLCGLRTYCRGFHRTTIPHICYLPFQLYHYTVHTTGLLRCYTFTVPARLRLIPLCTFFLFPVIRGLVLYLFGSSPFMVCCLYGCWFAYYTFAFATTPLYTLPTTHGSHLHLRIYWLFTRFTRYCRYAHTRSARFTFR